MNYTTPPNNASPDQTLKQEVTLKPKLGGFLWAYIIFSLPSFLVSLGVLLLTLLFLGGLLIGLIFGGSSSSQTAYLSYDTIQKGSTDNGILVYDLNGAIDTGSKSLPDSSRTTGIYTEIVAQDFAKIKADNKIKGVVFRMNTPGGAVYASEVLGDQLNNLVKSKGQKQAVFYFDQVVASGGLWATYKTENNYVIASNYGETGSIGVLMELSNVKGLADKVGYSEEVIKSAPSKDIGSPFRDLTSEERAFLQKQVDEKFNQFVDLVAKGRGLDSNKVRSFANGYVYTNSVAKDYGLVNELGGVDAAIKKAADASSLSGNYSVYEVRTDINPITSLLGGNAATWLGIPQSATKLINQATTIQPGQVYAIDETKI